MRSDNNTRKKNSCAKERDSFSSYKFLGKVHCASPPAR